MSSAAEIIAALGGNPRYGLARCPAHADSTPSLKVSEKNGRVLVHCHAGCSQAEVIKELKARGLWGNSQSSPSRINYSSKDKMKTTRDAYDKFRDAWAIMRAADGLIGPVEQWSKRPKKPTEYLQGRNIDLMPENLMFLSRACSIKLQSRIPGLLTFPAMVAPIVGPDRIQGCLVTYLTSDGTRNLRGKDSKKSIRRIYGASKGGYVQLGDIDSGDPPKTLIVAEGIETALSVSQLTDAPAIAVPGGNFRTIAPPLAKELIIATDNDGDGGGLKKATEAASLWVSNGRLVRLALAPDPHKDWNDAIRDSDADRDELSRLLRNAELFKSEKREIRALTMGELIDRNFPPREMMMSPWLAESSLAMLHAQRGTAKTRFMMSVAYAVAMRQSMFNWRVDRPRRVLFVDGELPATLLQERVKLLGPTTPNLLLLSRDVLLREGRVNLPDLATEDGRDFLDKIIERENVALIILDSLSTLIRSGVENEAESWAPVQDWLLHHRFHGRTVIIVHHEGRNNKQRGTSKREDVLDTILRLEAVSDEDGASEDRVTFELTFTKTREFYGADAAPMILHLSTQTGTARWTHEMKRDKTRDRVLELRKQGMKQKQIGDELGLSQERVSQLLKQYKSEAPQA